MNEDEISKLIEEHPDFRRTLHQFMALRDAAAVLDELKPPNYKVGAAWLREIGDHVMRDAGMPEEFLQAMIASRRPSLAETARNGDGQ